MSAFVYPYPRPSNGLLDGATDFIGGDPLQEPFITDYPVNADGHIIIPAEDVTITGHELSEHPHIPTDEKPHPAG